MGWLGKTNGELLRAAESEFDAFLTIDRRLPFQQNLSGYSLAVVVVRGSRNNPELATELVMAVGVLLDSNPGNGVHWIDLA